MKRKSIKEIGYLGENIAARYLVGKGYSIVAKNYSKPWGEIDIVAIDQDVYVFVEVKSNGREYGDSYSPEHRVNYSKIKRIVRTSALFMEYEANRFDTSFRIDIVSVTFMDNFARCKIRHIRNINI